MNNATPSDDSLDSPTCSEHSEVSMEHAEPTKPAGEPFLATPADKPIELPVLSQKHLGIPRVRRWIPIVLFVATCASTFFAGAMSWEPHQIFAAGDAGMFVRQTILRFAGQGTTYMVCVVAILFAHEMGHYIATKIYGIPSTPPFFIPFPIAPIGTMGAVIAMKGQQADRKEIFDIGIAGPLAGLVLAVPILWLGVGQLDPSAPNFGTYRYDLPLLVRWMYYFQHPGAPALTEVSASQVNAMFMAGWVGLLITGLNMMPVSQLDGGHVTYTLFGRNSRWIARVFVAVALAYMVINRVYIWMLMLILVFLIGLYHPPTSDDSVPLGKWRVRLGLASLLIPVLCFPPRGLMPY